MGQVEHASEGFEKGTRFGPYTIVRLLGEGGMGAVYEAVHTGLDKRVALKTMHAEATANPEAVARFVREGKTAAKLQHPHVVDITDVGVENGVPYLVMEYLEGTSLANIIDPRRPLDVTLAVDLALPIVDALAVAHDHGVVHRDLKPDNIFLTRTRTGAYDPKLLDFGISKIEQGASTRLTQASAFMGTPQYMSPEQARGARDVDGRSDQFSFGLVLYEMLTGTRAVDGDVLLEVVHRISSVDIVPIHRLRPQLPPGLVAVVNRMLALSPAQRFESMRDVAAALVPFASQGAAATWGEEHTKVDPLARPVAASTPPLTTMSGAASEITTQPQHRARPIVLMAGAGATVLIGLVIAVAAVILHNSATGSAGAPVVHVAPPLAPVAFGVDVRATPAAAAISLDGAQSAIGELRATLPHDGRHHVLDVRAPGFIDGRIEFVDAPPSVVALQPVPIVAPAPPVAPIRPHAARAPIALTAPTHAAPPTAVEHPHPVAPETDTGDVVLWPNRPVPPARPRTGANGAPILH